MNSENMRKSFSGKISIPKKIQDSKMFLFTCFYNIFDIFEKCPLKSAFDDGIAHSNI